MAGVCQKCNGCGTTVYDEDTIGMGARGNMCNECYKHTCDVLKQAAKRMGCCDVRTTNVGDEKPSVSTSNTSACNGSACDPQSERLVGGDIAEDRARFVTRTLKKNVPNDGKRKVIGVLVRGLLSELTKDEIIDYAMVNLESVPTSALDNLYAEVEACVYETVSNRNTVGACECTEKKEPSGDPRSFRSSK